MKSLLAAIVAAATLADGDAVSGVGLVLLGTRHNGCFGLGQVR